MDVSTELFYPHASLDDVYGLALDEEFRAAVCLGTGALEHDVDVRRCADGSTTVTVRRTMPADVPAVVRRFVGQTIQIVQTESWAPLGDASAGRRAALSVQVVGQPAAMTGSLALDTREEGVREVVRGDLRVSLPFVGKAVEAEIAKAVLAAARHEEQLGRQWLAARR